jgi:S-adenosyl methyltransferase
VACAARQTGIRQSLYIGTGIPTSPDTHQTAPEADPAARVVHVGNDPLVLVHARALLTGTKEGVTSYIEADLREPREILEHPDLRATLDLSRPVALVLVAVLHFIRDDQGEREIVDTVSQWWPADVPEPRPAVEDVACNGLVARVVRRS